MKVHYKTRNGRLIFELEGQSPKKLFHDIAVTQEIFEADSTCGCCNSPNIRLRVRMPQDVEFHEMYCDDCAAALSFGQTRQGDRLFAKRKDSEGQLLPNRGWRVWRKEIATASSIDGSTVKADDLPF